jgi:flagellar hook-associated protein 3 FlgL
MMSRISTSNNHLITIDSLNRRQSSLAEMQKQISSGIKYDSFAGVALDGETRRVIGFESAVNRIETFQRNNKFMQIRLETMDKSVENILDVNKDVIAEIIQERSANKESVPLTQILKGALQRIEDQLNVTSSGRFLFSGSQTDKKPISSLQTSNLDGTTPTDNYYQGDAVDLSQKISNDVTIQYNVRANDPVFQKLIGAIHRAIAAEANNDDSGLAAAFDLANEAQSELTGMRSTIGTNLKNIEEVVTDNQNFRTYYKNTLGEVTGTDVAETSIQLSLDQAILTASFQAFARISGLTLSNFLN